MSLVTTSSICGYRSRPFVDADELRIPKAPGRCVRAASLLIVTVFLTIFILKLNASVPGHLAELSKKYGFTLFYISTGRSVSLVHASILHLISRKQTTFSTGHHHPTFLPPEPTLCSYTGRRNVTERLQFLVSRARNQ